MLEPMVPGLWNCRPVALQVVTDFQSDSKELTLSFLSSPAATYFLYRPWLPIGREKPRNKQTNKTQNGKTRKHPMKTSDPWLACPPPPRCQMLLFYGTQVAVQENCLLGPPFPCISGSTLLITGCDYSTSIYWPSVSSLADQMLTRYLFVLCTGYSKMY